MAWVRYDQGFPRHPKVRRAARLLGSNGLGRVLAVHFEATCYCNEHLTDGRIDNSIARLLESDRNPIQVLRVFARSSIRLAIQVKGGFQLHDYHDYQPSKKEVEETRKKERERKRKARGRPLDVPTGHQPESGGPIRHDTADTTRHQEDQDHRADARASHSILVRLAHEALDEGGTLGDATERMKVLVSRANVGIYDSGMVARAFDAALVQRAKAS